MSGPGAGILGFACHALIEWDFETDTLGGGGVCCVCERGRAVERSSLFTIFGALSLGEGYSFPSVDT